MCSSDLTLAENRREHARTLKNAHRGMHTHTSCFTCHKHTGLLISQREQMTERERERNRERNRERETERESATA